MAAIRSFDAFHNQVFYQWHQVTIIIYLTLVPGSLRIVTYSWTAYVKEI